MFPIACPNCRARFKGKPEHVGRNIKCPKCEHRFTVQPPPADDGPNELDQPSTPPPSRSRLSASSSRSPASTTPAAAAPPVVTTTTDQPQSRLPAILTIVGIVVLIGVGAAVALIFIGGDDKPTDPPPPPQRRADAGASPNDANDGGPKKPNTQKVDPSPTPRTPPTAPDTSTPAPPVSDKLRRDALATLDKLRETAFAQPGYSNDELLQVALLYGRLGERKAFDELIGQWSTQADRMLLARRNEAAPGWAKIAAVQKSMGDERWPQSLAKLNQALENTAARIEGDGLSTIVEKLMALGEAEQAKAVVDSILERANVRPGQPNRNVSPAVLRVLALVDVGRIAELGLNVSVANGQVYQPVLDDLFRLRNHAAIVEWVRICPANRRRGLFQEALSRLLLLGDLDAVEALVLACPEQDIAKLTGWRPLVVAFASAGLELQAEAIAGRLRAHPQAVAFAALAPTWAEAGRFPDLNGALLTVPKSLERDRIAALLAVAHHRAGQPDRFEPALAEMKAHALDDNFSKLWTAEALHRVGREDEARKLLPELFAHFIKRDEASRSAGALEVCLNLIARLGDDALIQQTFERLRGQGRRGEAMVSTFISVLLDADRADPVVDYTNRRLVSVNINQHYVDTIRQIVQAGYGGLLLNPAELVSGRTTWANAYRHKHWLVLMAVADHLDPPQHDPIKPSKKAYHALLPTG